MSAISLRRRVLLSMMVVITVWAVCLSLYLYGTRDVLRRGLMHGQAKEIAAGFLASGDTALLPAEYGGGAVSYTLYGPDGTLLWMSPDRSRPLRLRSDSLEDLAKSFWYGRAVGRFINVPVRLDDGHILMVSRNDQQERVAIETLLDARLKHSLMLLVPLALVFCALMWALMAWTLAPVRRATQLAGEIGPGRARPIPEDSLPSEIRPLAAALNRAVVRLGDTIETERQILANGAHELRTPLTVVDLRLQKFEQEGYTDWPVLRNDLQRLRRVIEQLLRLAHQDHATLSDSGGQCRLAAVVRDVIADLYPLFESAGRAIHAELGSAEPVVEGEDSAVREAVMNVIENACAHGAGEVHVRLTVDDGNVLLDIEDQGEGVSMTGQSEYFERFHKGRQGSPGAGLDLAIVRRIMSNLGGSVRFISASPCVVRLRFVMVGEPPAPGTSER